jgi:predicted RNA-binding Zn-ribbon protein involved in translation (DUF1610 family)
MGVYDIVKVPCPVCGTVEYAQSKSGDCLMELYTLDNVPANVIWDVNRHSPFKCPNCGALFEVNYELESKVSNVRVTLVGKQ